MAARLALAVATGAASVLPGFLIGTLALQIGADLDVRVEAVAAGVTVFFLAGAFGAGWGGRLADHIGALRAMRRCVFISAASLGAAALAPTLLVLFALLAVAGVANSITQPAINLFVAEQIAPDRQGFGFGIKQSGIPAAILLSGLALPVLALPLGWRTTVGICALAPLAVAIALPRGETAHVSRRTGSRRPSRALFLTALGAALGTAGPSALGAYLVASAVDVGIGEGTAGLLAALGSGLSLAMRVWLGARADRKRDYGLTLVVVLLMAGSVGFAVMASGTAALFVAGMLVAFTLGWGWNGLFNLAVVDSNRETPGSASGVTQTGIYVGGAAGPAAFGAIAASAGYGAAWLLVAATTLSAAAVLWRAARLGVRPIEGSAANSRV
ncbi:MAG TPA: MFS transporter [Thermoleophilaceae bacterium]|nr:MFS transporter [Thermoleophilaceae bacterium]